MNYKKAKTILRKLNTLLDSFESLKEPVSEIEAEMLNRYTDEFKKLIPSEVIIEDGPEIISKHSREDSRATQIVEIVKPTAKKANKSAAKLAKKEIVKIPDEIIVAEVEIEELVELEVPQSIEVNDEEFDVPPIIVEKAKPKPSPVKKLTPKKKKLVGDDEDEMEDGDLWAKKVFADLSEKLSYSPIKNIYKSLSINERMFTEAELFGGDHLLFRSVLEQVEKMSTFEQAVEFLKSGVAVNQKWEGTKKHKKAAQFMKLIQRRFL